MEQEQFDTLVRGISAVLDNVRTPQFRPPSVNFFMPNRGQLQFTIAAPRYREVERKNPKDAGVRWADKMGAVFVEAAPALPNSDKLDWDNKKMIFAMSDKDIGQVLWGFAAKKEDIRLVHAPDENAKQNNKTFRIRKGDDFRGEPQWILSLTEKKNGESNEVSVFIKGPDMMRLKSLLEGAIPYILGAHRT
jgi:hypothetical protein